MWPSCCICVHTPQERLKKSGRERMAEWLGTVTLVWEVWVKSPEMADFSFDWTLTQGLKILGEKLT